MPNRPRQVALNLGLAALYVLAARLGLAFDPVSGFATLVWPATGISLAAILLFGNRVAPGLFLGALSTNLLAGAPLVVALGIGIGNAPYDILCTQLPRIVHGFSMTLERFTSVISLNA